MKKVDWNKLAAMSEVIGTVAIVVSLAFVVQSVNQNTEILQNTNLNHVYDRLDSLNSDIAADPQLSVIYANRVFGLEDITADDAVFLVTMRREINQWEQYFTWNLDGLLDDSEWADWDAYPLVKAIHIVGEGVSHLVVYQLALYSPANGIQEDEGSRICLRVIHGRRLYVSKLLSSSVDVLYAAVAFDPQCLTDHHFTSPKTLLGPLQIDVQNWSLHDLP